MNKLITTLVACVVAPFLMASVAFADPTVDLQILNATGASGEIIVVGGEDVEVSFIVTLDTGGVTHKKDRLELVDLFDESVASSKLRGNSTSGSVILSVPAGVVAAQFYVRYVLQSDDSEIARVSHPDDAGSVPLVAVQEASTAELTARVEALEATDPIPGPQGDPGPQGPQGDPGTDGADGIDGTNGTNGINGTNGTDGTDGIDGTNGTDGIDGTNGVDGTDGAQGPPGVLSFATENTAGGDLALPATSTGSFNTAFGYDALGSSPSGNSNTGVGRDALRSNTTGGGNTAVGNVALASNQTTLNNSALGNGSLNALTSGGGNTAVGVNAMALATNAADNVAVGFASLLRSDGTNNTAVGRNSLNDNLTGSNNTALGNGSGEFVLGSDNIHIGNAGLAGDSNITRIGTVGTHNQAYVAGIINNDLTATGTPVVVGPDGQLGIGDSGSGLAGYERVSFSSVQSVAPGVYRAASVGCPAGKKVLGGGFAAIDDDLVIRSSIPPNDTTWNVVFKNESTTVTVVTSVAVWAVCATIP